MYDLPGYLILMVLAGIGAVGKQVLGYMIAKEDNPNMKFSWRYVQATILFVGGIVYMFTDPALVFTGKLGLAAFFTGWGGQNALVKVLQLLPTPSKSCDGE